MTRWERVAADIREQIRSGQLRPGDQIPTYQQLVDHYGWSYQTVRMALWVLRQEGWIGTERGVRSWVREDHPE